MMDAIAKAFSTADRSYHAAKASTASKATPSLIAAGTPAQSGGQYFTATNDAQKLGAMKSWVWVAIRAIANRIAQQSFQAGHVLTHRRKLGSKSFNADENMEVIEDHPAVELLRDPNDIMTGYGLRWATVASICLTGRALWWVTTIDGEKHLFYIPTSWIVGHVGETGYEGFTIRPPHVGEAFTLPSDECVFFSQPDPADPWKSISPLDAVAESVNSDHDILTAQRAAFSNGIMPGMAVIVGKDENGIRPTLSNSQRKQIISAIKRRFQGPQRAGEPVILDGLVERIEKLSLTPDEMGFQQSGKDVRDRILMAFGVSGYCVGASEPGSRAASAVADYHLVANVIRPILALINAALQEWYVPIVNEGNERLKIWLSEPEVDDQEMRHRKVELCCMNGVITVPELRRYAGLPEDQTFAGQVVGGMNMETTNPIQQGLRNMIDNAVAGNAADEIIERSKSYHLNGRK